MMKSQSRQRAGIRPVGRAGRAALAIGTASVYDGRNDASLKGCCRIRDRTVALKQHLLPKQQIFAFLPLFCANLARVSIALHQPRVFIH
ncbi:MAG: hypothetical protein LAT56_01415 [Wenzhouxiangella sp.]|nr:hypothetical protein [Wenzhouxiangella sp.]